MRGTADLLIVFPEDFSEQITAYEESEQPPDIKTFYNPSEEYSQAARDTMLGMLETVYEKELLEERFGNLNVVTAFTIDSTNEESEIQDENKAAGRMLGMLLPYLITILLFAGTMSLGTDTITGEKERGTLACMLVTPIKRSEIVLGKLLALTIMSILSASVYVVSFVIALPKSIGSIAAEGLNVSFNPQQIAMMAAIVLSLAFLYVPCSDCQRICKNCQRSRNVCDTAVHDCNCGRIVYDVSYIWRGSSISVYDSYLQQQYLFK